jgi:hypothetical protein
MTERAQNLADTTDTQISQLTELLATLDDTALHRPCPGREKLGDGTIGGALLHTADNYHRIAGFLETSVRMSTGHTPEAQGGHRIPKFLRAFGHDPHDHNRQDQGAGQHDDVYTAENIDTALLLAQLDASRKSLEQLSGLTDNQLDQVPPKDSFRFCDGQRTLEQVITGVLKHQAHQLEALSSGT